MHTFSDRKTFVENKTFIPDFLCVLCIMLFQAKKPKEAEDSPGDPSFQDFEYPEYDDYRAEAFLHQQKRMECYSKAKEAYRMGKKNVATFYAQQVKRKTGYSSFINCDI